MEIHSAITNPVSSNGKSTLKEIPYSKQFKGTLLFTDLTNFTSISERMSSLGAAGVEMLAKHLNNYFGQIIEMISSHGGELYKFAGDALISVFSEDAFPMAGKSQDEIFTDLTLRAVQCGLEIQSKLGKYLISMSDGYSFQLTIRIGVGTSEMQAFHIGGVDNYVEYVLDGEAFAQLKTTIEGDSGNVVCSPESWSYIKKLCDGVPIIARRYSNPVIFPSGAPGLAGLASRKPVVSNESNFPTPSALTGNAPPERIPQNNQRVLSVLSPVPIQPLRNLPDVETLKKMEDHLSSYIQWAVVERIKSGQLLYLGEFRLVTVLFINLTSLVLTKAHNLDRANKVIRVIQRAVMNYEGFVRQTLVDDKGTVCIIVFGAPVSHEDDAVRGIRAAMQIRKELEDMQQTTSIGITSGKCYCGALGNTKRQEYAVVGDIVNLSARLMKAAEDLGHPMLCDMATYNRTNQAWVFDSHTPVTVKGKTLPIEIFTPIKELKAEKTKAGRKVEIIGRKKERAVIQEAIQKLSEGKGRTILIEGEAGFGKSILCDYARATASENEEITVLEGGGDPIDRYTPYLPWKRVFEEIFQINFTDCLDTVKKNIGIYTENSPWASKDCLAFLNGVIRLKIEESDYTQTVTGKNRSVQTLDLLLHLFCSFVEKKGKVVLILDDCHALDISSLALLAKVVKRVEGIVVILASRPMSSPLWNEMTAHLKRKSMFDVCKLDSMSEEDGKSILCEIFKVRSISDEVWNMFKSSWNGIPFFLQELARSLRSSNMVVVDNDKCDVNVTNAGNLQTIPESIEQMITSTIDVLPLPQQLILKVASVIGQVFDFVTLRGIFPIREHVHTLSENLSALVQCGIIEEDRHHGHWRFHNSMIRDVAYNLLLNSQKIELHTMVATYIENTFENYISFYYTLLAYHLCNAVILRMTGVEPTVVVKAVNFLLKSIDLSKESFADEEVRSKCQLGLQVVERLPSEHPDRKNLENSLYLRLAMSTQLMEEASEYFSKSKLPSLSDTIAGDFTTFHFKRKNDDTMEMPPPLVAPKRLKSAEGPKTAH
eukprot:TRINITY_DN2712_c0_g1_i3.p1 TRINITY_DN2712_c0_g1~~TRINITY_DN2712_c0_g1_i3.p1  ORF type:complete len:1050 (-),score=272.70 TRINITY_DN2712_c0_g1_i3:36-3185(-)